MITEKNKFFNPADYDAEVFGFFEELIAFDASSSYGFRTLGTRRLPGLPDRPIGSDGRTVVELTESVTLQKGHKPAVVVKASKAKPIKCYAMIYPLFGERKG